MAITFITIIAVLLASVPLVSPVNSYAAANGVPGQPTLSHDNGSYGPDYNVNLDLWWGNNGAIWVLYENDKVVYYEILKDNTPQPQHGSYSVKNKPAGMYTYRANLINAYGVSTTSTIYVTVNGSTPTPTPDRDPSPTPTPTDFSGIQLKIASASPGFVTLSWYDSDNRNDYHVYQNGNWKAWTDGRKFTLPVPASGDVSFFVTGGTQISSNTIVYNEAKPFNP